MKLYIPNSAFLGNIESFIRKIDTSNPQILEISFNEKWTSVHPIVLSMTVALARDMTTKRANIVVNDAVAKSSSYLARMGLFDMLGVTRPVGSLSESAGRFIPLRILRTDTELNDFMAETTPLLHSSPQAADTIKYVISELVRNVFEHAGHPNNEAVVCAQFFKKTNRFTLGIADAGIGVQRSLEVHHGVRDDLSAIKLALQPGVSGTTPYFGGAGNNAGAGLFIVKGFAQVSRSYFMIYSGRALFKLLKTPPRRIIRLNADPEKDKATMTNNLPYWQGTAVGFDISLNRSKDLADLLAMVKDAFRMEIKQRKKQKYKKPRFI